jgi:hypothetical protein
MAKKLVPHLNPKWPMPVKFLGGGVNGRVYETNDGRLMKFIYNHAPQEYMTLQKLQGTYVVPRFKKGDGVVKGLDAGASKSVRRNMFPSTNQSNYLTAFVMGRAGGSHGMTLTKYLEAYPSYNMTNVQHRVKYLIEQMALRGVSHGNLHSNNIIVTATPSGRISGMWAIDFGRSHRLKVGKTERETMKRLPLNEMHTTHSTFSHRKHKNVPVREGSRANVHMMGVHYNHRLSPSWERRIANIRKQVREEMKQYKSPRRSAPKAKSLSLKRKSVSASLRRGRSASRTMP